MFRLPPTVALFLACVLSAATCLASPWLSTAQGEEKEKPVKPLLSLLGSQSKITKKGYHRIESPEAWNVLWAKHNTGAEQPEETHPAAIPYPQAEVDFDRCMVVAVFQGKGANCNGFRVHSVLETDEQITCRIQGLYYGTGPKAHETAAWGAFVLPRSTKRLLVELDTRSEKIDPPKWTKVAEFKAGNRSLEK